MISWSGEYERMQIIWHCFGGHWHVIATSRRFRSWCNGSLICIGDILGGCGLKILLLQYYYHGHDCNRYMLDESYSDYPQIIRANLSPWSSSSNEYSETQQSICCRAGYQRRHDLLAHSESASKGITA